jgi:hypothetical protein
MNVLYTEIFDVMQVLFGPQGQALFYMQIGTGIIAYLFVFHLLGSAFDFRRTDLPPMLIGTGVGCLVLLVATALAGLHMPSGLVSAQWIRPAAAGIALLAVVTPLYCLLVKANYLRVFGALALAAMASTLIVFFAKTAVLAVTDGRDSVNPARARKAQIENLVN